MHNFVYMPGIQRNLFTVESSECPEHSQSQISGAEQDELLRKSILLSFMVLCKCPPNEDDPDQKKKEQSRVR